MIMALVRTVAVVVPSPAMSFVAEATCLTRFAPTFWNLSLKSIALATETPSFVILGEPNGCSITTWRPWRGVTSESEENIFKREKKKKKARQLKPEEDEDERKLKNWKKKKGKALESNNREEEYE